MGNLKKQTFYTLKTEMDAQYFFVQAFQQQVQDEAQDLMNSQAFVSEAKSPIKSNKVKQLCSCSEQGNTDLKLGFATRHLDYNSYFSIKKHDPTNLLSGNFLVK